MSYKLLFLGHRSFIKNKTQTAVINIVNKRILIISFSCAKQHTFSKVTVTVFESCLYTPHQILLSLQGQPEPLSVSTKLVAGIAMNSI